MLASSYLDAELVAGTPITEPDTGPGGIYARLDGARPQAGAVPRGDPLADAERRTRPRGSGWQPGRRSS